MSGSFPWPSGDPPWPGIYPGDGQICPPQLPDIPVIQDWLRTLFDYLYNLKPKTVQSVKDYGAVGDGIADDTAAVQRAVAASRMVFFPPGIYNLGSVNCAQGTRIVGSGNAQTILNKTTSTGNLFSFLAGGNSVSDLKVVTNNQTSGALFDFSLGNAIVSRVLTLGGNDVVIFRGDVQTFVSDCTFDNFVGKGVSYLNGYVGFAYINNLNMFGDGVTSNGIGLLIESGDTFVISNTSIAGMVNNAAFRTVAGGRNLFNIFATNVLCDGIGGSQQTAGGPGWLIDGTAAGNNLSRVFLSNCWSGSNMGHGFEIQGVSDVRLMSCSSINNHLHGVWLGSTPSEPMSAQIRGCTISGNSNGSPNVYGGIFVDDQVRDFHITDNRIGFIGQNPNTQSTGVWVSGPNNDHYIITGNSLQGNLTVAISDSGAGTNKIVTGNLLT